MATEIFRVDANNRPGGFLFQVVEASEGIWKN